VGHVARMRGMINAYNILVRQLGGDHSEELGADWIVLLECIVEIQVGKVCTGFIWLRLRASGGIL
jgi:hypothetical protein